MKMAEKRAHVDAILRTTAASGIFTQDLKENVAVIVIEPVEPAAAPATPATRQSRDRTEPPPISDADLAGLTSTAPARTEAAMVEGQFREAPAPVEGLTAHQLVALAKAAGKNKAHIAEAIGCPLVDITQRLGAMSDVERGVLADELNLDWRSAA